MPRSIDDTIRAMFDVRPVKSGDIDLAKIRAVSERITLRTIKNESSLNPEPLIPTLVDSKKNVHVIRRKVSTPIQPEKPKNFDFIINNEITDSHVQLVSMGIDILDNNPIATTRSSRSALIPKAQFSSLLISQPEVEPDQDYSDVLSKIREPLTEGEEVTPIPSEVPVQAPDFSESEPSHIPSSGEIDHLLSHNKEIKKEKAVDVSVAFPNKTALLSSYWKKEVPPTKNKRNINYKKYLIVGGIIIALAWLLKSYGLNIKNQILKDGNSAVKSLEAAEGNLKSFDFKEASVNFTKAYEDFSKASGNLNLFGSSMSSLISHLPGAGALKSARNLIELGQSIASSGQAMSSAVSYLSETGSILDPSNKATSNARIIEALSNALFLSQKNINKASDLLADINIDDIPEEKRSDFEKLSRELPSIKTAVDQAANYSDFIEKLVAVGGKKKYILLFQNNSELRPTGGFPGTYGVITFEDGNLQDFKVDDIYNFDGQIKKDIIPPKQMQHITPTWGMRDANWFADFPTSAKKIMWFYHEISGDNVDGVITVSPEIITSILKIVGPIEMPQYKITITAENFLAEIQEEVEYGPNRTQPKQVVKDLAPKLLERIYSIHPDGWLEIFGVIMAALERKDMSMYFNDLTLKNFALENDFAGQVKKSDSDYLMVNFSNIKGSKTDTFTDSDVRVSTLFKDGMAIHKLTISRDHQGGDTKYGFYNRQNPAYVRVLVPEDAQLLEISGNDDPDYKPLINYKNSKFVHDEDLKKFEAGFNYDPSSGVSLFSESGKKGFGFWMITDPGKTKTVELRYAVPIEEEGYSLYIQKQPGIVLKKFEIVMRGPDGKTAASFSSLFNKVGSVFEYSSPLEKDVILNASFR